MKKHNALIVLSALLEGMSIKTDSIYNICMSEDNYLCYKIESQLFQADWDFNGFIKFCERMSEEEIVCLAASVALKKSVRKA